MLPNKGKAKQKENFEMIQAQIIKGRLIKYTEAICSIKASIKKQKTTPAPFNI